MSFAWKQLPERGSTSALALITWIGTVIGRPAGRLLLYPITLYFLLTAGTARRGSRLFLHRVQDSAPGWRHVFRHIYCFAATILDRIFLLGGQFDRFDIKVHNGQIVLDRIATGRGCILLGSHLGSFEMLRVLGVMRRQFPLKVLMDVDHNPDITKFLNSLNREISSTIIPIRGPATLLEVRERLQEGYLVGMLGDRVMSDCKITKCRFFGAEAYFPTGPMLLAALASCPIVLIFALYMGGNRYDVYFEYLIDHISEEDRLSRDDVQRLTQRYAERLEHYTRMAPYNWFNFYDFWGDDQRGRR